MTRTPVGESEGGGGALTRGPVRQPLRQSRKSRNIATFGSRNRGTLRDGILRPTQPINDRHGGDEMAFPEVMKQLVFVRANRRCECERLGHDHEGRCPVGLSEDEAHFRHRIAVVRGGRDTYANCELLCPECYSRLPRLVAGPAGSGKQSTEELAPNAA